MTFWLALFPTLFNPELGFLQKKTNFSCPPTPCGGSKMTQGFVSKREGCARRGHGVVGRVVVLNKRKRQPLCQCKQRGRWRQDFHTKVASPYLIGLFFLNGKKSGREALEIFKPTFLIRSSLSYYYVAMSHEMSHLDLDSRVVCFATGALGRK